MRFVFVCIEAFIGAGIALLLSGCAKPALAPRVFSFDATSGWVDLVPSTRVQVETAYFREGALREGIANYLGTQTASFEVNQSRGLVFQGAAPEIKPAPADQPAVDQLVPRTFRGYRRYRYYFSIVFTRQGRTGGAALLAANSDREMGALGRGMATAPDEACPPAARHCLVFPNTSTVSVLINVTVNGEPRWINGGMRASALNAQATSLSIARNGATIRLTSAMREWFITTLMPGDAVTFP